MQTKKIPFTGCNRADHWTFKNRLQDYLLDEKGIQINALMAATAWNLKKLMEELKQKVKHFFRLVCIRCFLPEYFLIEGA
jgi:hypothetical protein